MKREKHIDTQANPIKRVPQRTCIVCRQVKAKRELVRIVRTDTGVMVDTSGKKPGRGAYLCKAKECWENGLKGDRLGYVMRTTLTQQDRQQLQEYANKL
ncbi:MAG: YlxR family protein [Dehalococcoidales bacterium]|nr:YlxR family protein [Dehalococcoidales bacterium]